MWDSRVVDGKIVPNTAQWIDPDGRGVVGTVPDTADNGAMVPWDMTTSPMPDWAMEELKKDRIALSESPTLMTMDELQATMKRMAAAAPVEASSVARKSRLSRPLSSERIVRRVRVRRSS